MMLCSFGLLTNLLLTLVLFCYSKVFNELVQFELTLLL